MPEYQLYCFAQSGNAYRAALMLNLIGADWQPVFVDFFKGGETRTPKYRAEVNEMGEVPVLVHGAKKLSQSGVILTYLAEHSGKFKPTTARTRGSKRCAGSFSTIRRSTAFSGRIRFLNNFAKPAGDPAVMAFLKGRIDGSLAHCRQAAVAGAIHARQPADHRRPVVLSPISIIRPTNSASILPADAQEYRRLARSHESAARLGTSLRPDARPSAAAIISSGISRAFGGVAAAGAGTGGGCGAIGATGAGADDATGAAGAGGATGLTAGGAGGGAAERTSPQEPLAFGGIGAGAGVGAGAGGVGAATCGAGAARVEQTLPQAPPALVVLPVPALTRRPASTAGLAAGAGGWADEVASTFGGVFDVGLWLPAAVA